MMKKKKQTASQLKIMQLCMLHVVLIDLKPLTVQQNKSQLENFKIFPGEHAPEPPRGSHPGVLPRECQNPTLPFTQSTQTF